MSTFYESPFARYLPDEVNPIFSEIAPPATPPGRPVRYSSWTRIRADRSPVHGSRSCARPSPSSCRSRIAPRAAAPRRPARRSHAARSSSSISNAASAINVSQVSGVVRSLGGVIERRREATDALQKSLEASLEQFKIGELTLLDTIVTEQNLTNELLQLTSDLQLYASAAARLAFETGSLVQFDAAGTPLEKIAFAPLTVPIRRGAE